MSAPTALSAVSPSLADLQQVQKQVKTQKTFLERQPAGKEGTQGTAITDPHMEEVLFLKSIEIIPPQGQLQPEVLGR